MNRKERRAQKSKDKVSNGSGDKIAPMPSISASISQPLLSPALSQIAAAIPSKPSSPNLPRANVLEKELADALGSIQNLLQSGDVRRAEQESRSLLSHYPDNPYVLRVLGTCLALQNKAEEAVQCFLKVVKIFPNDAMSWRNLGLVYRALQDFEKSLEALAKAMALVPDQVELYDDIGHTYHFKGDHEQALLWFHKALEVHPGHHASIVNIARTLQSIERYDELIEFLRGVVKEYPDDAESHRYLGVFLLFKKQFLEGFTEYEWRLKEDAYQKLDVYKAENEFPAPVWNGENLNGKTLVILHEQGIGDQFCLFSMVPDLLEMGAKLIIVTEPRTAFLIERSFPGVKALPIPDFLKLDPKSVDYKIYLASIAKFLRPDLASFPKRESYLRPDPQKVAEISARYRKKDPKQIVVGIAWRSMGTPYQNEKSINLADWKDILSVEGVKFVSLQYGDVTREVDYVGQSLNTDIFRDWRIDQVRDIDGFAAQVAAMDLIISISNATVHMAGSLGVPVWTLTPRGIGLHWPWAAEGDDNHFYPTMRILRQEKPTDWSGILTKAGGDLKRFVEDLRAKRIESADERNQRLYSVIPKYRLKDMSPSEIPVLNLDKAQITTLFDQQRFAEAQQLAEIYLLRRPADPEVMALLAQACWHQGLYSKTIDLLESLRALYPTDLRGLYQLALAYKAEKRFSQALAVLTTALQLQPQNSLFHHLLGVVKYDMGDHSGALLDYDKALAIDPTAFAVLTDRGLSLLALGRDDEAAAAFERALSIKPDYALAHASLSAILLSRGQFKDGFAHYRWRKEAGHLAVLPIPSWQGENLKDKTIAICAGSDMSQQALSASMIPDLIDQGAQVIAEVTPSLVPVLARSFPQAIVVENLGERLHPALVKQKIDYKAGLGDLGLHLRPDQSAFPSRNSLFKADEQWRAFFANDYRRASAGCLVIGLACRDASIDWAKILTLPNAGFVLLNDDDKNEWSKRLAGLSDAGILHDPDSSIAKDGERFAARLAALDMVIGDDQEVIHLAGALGVPTALMLQGKETQSWYWSEWQGRNLFYPALRVFTKDHAEDWARAIERIASYAHDIRQNLSDRTIGDIATPPQSIAELLAKADTDFKDGHYEDALKDAELILARQPNRPEALWLKGTIGCLTRNFEEAASSLERFVKYFPNRGESWNNLGTALVSLKRLDEALYAFRNAVEASPGIAEFQTHLARLLLMLGRADDAIPLYRMLAENAPEKSQAQIDLMGCLIQAGRFQDALSIADKALSAGDDKSAPLLLANKAQALKGLARYQEAYDVLNQALSRDASIPSLHRDLAELLMSLGYFAQGFPEYEWRFRMPAFAKSVPAYPYPLWAGEPLAGKTILIWREQGLGDEILFSSMVPDLIEQGAKVIIEASPRLIPLLARSFPSATIVERNAPETQNADIAYQAPMGYLGRWVRADRNAFPRRHHYMLADAERAKALAARYRRNHEGKLVVGLSWMSEGSAYSRLKSTDLMAWRDILALPGVVFVNLQYGDHAAELAQIARELGVEILSDSTIDPLQDMDGFAAQVAAMDLVITTSNTTPHLAGALGVPVWTLVPRSGMGLGWYWGVTGDQTPFYASMRIFRQKQLGDWQSLLSDVASRLRIEVEKRQLEPA